MHDKALHFTSFTYNHRLWSLERISAGSAYLRESVVVAAKWPALSRPGKTLHTSSNQWAAFADLFNCSWQS